MYIFLRILLWIFVAWRCGDWRNWKNYQSTFLISFCLTLTLSLIEQGGQVQ
jgi:hypothetical protein